MLVVGTNRGWWRGQEALPVEGRAGIIRLRLKVEWVGRVLGVEGVEGVVLEGGRGWREAILAGFVIMMLLGCSWAWGMLCVGGGGGMMCVFVCVCVF